VSCVTAARRVSGTTLSALLRSVQRAKEAHDMPFGKVKFYREEEG
jgi:hypothetical protein